MMFSMQLMQVRILHFRWPILLIHIVSQVKTIQNQSYNFMKFNLPILHFFYLLKKKLHATHFLKLFDKICKYEMDPASIVEDTEGTPFCPQMDRRTRWNQCIPPPSREYDYYINTSNGSWCQGIMGKCPAQFMSHCYGISFVEYVFESHYLPHHYGQSSPYCVILGPHTLINK